MKYVKVPRIKKSLSVLGFGCGHLHVNGIEAGEELIKKAIASGINYFDVAPTYPDADKNYGLNEMILGRAIYNQKEKVFVATKILARNCQGAEWEIKQSLKRLGKIDLIQLHAVDTPETMEVIFSQTGALSAAIRAKAEGLVNYIGITNHHDPFVLEECLRRFNFDSVTMPLGPVDAAGGRFLHIVKNIFLSGKLVVGMKIFGSGSMASMAKECLKFALRQPLSVALAGISDIEELNNNLATLKETSLSRIEEDRLTELAMEIIKLAWWQQKPSGPHPFGNFLERKEKNSSGASPNRLFFNLE